MVEALENVRVDGCEVLQASHVQEPEHRPLSSSKPQVRVFRPVDLQVACFIPASVLSGLKAILHMRQVISERLLSHRLGSSRVCPTVPLLGHRSTSSLPKEFL